MDATKGPPSQVGGMPPRHVRWLPELDGPSSYYSLATHRPTPPGCIQVCIRPHPCVFHSPAISLFAAPNPLFLRPDSRNTRLELSLCLSPPPFPLPTYQSIYLPACLPTFVLHLADPLPAGNDESDVGAHNERSRGGALTDPLID
eukprot:GHVU01034101.1.p2 GENE.GHVU01034101.1~~GHVU01034101.1.p2  ORF type:complete len:145 (+),score=11.65 GHVU01034101.1:58-492(+)